MSEARAMARRALVVVGFAVALVVATPATADDVGDRKAEVDARIAALRSEIEVATGQEGVLTSQLSAVSAELEAAQAAVDQAQASVSSLEAELTAARLQLERLTERLERQTRRVERLRGELARAVGILEAHVRAMYMDEPPDVVSVLVSATSFDELIDNVELLGRINAQDRRIANQVEQAKQRAEAARRETASTRRLQAAAVSVISARTEEARAARDRLAAERDTLAAARSLKQSALRTARATREEYLQEVEALAAQSAALAETIRASQAGAGSGGTGAPSAAGLVWPVAGPVVSGFGMRWGRMHEGIDIAAASGTPVRAAAAGVVIYAGWLGGYGNLVVLDHGSGLATAYAHASVIVVGVRQQVLQGQTVSLVGSTGHTTGPHLHFEVRVNGVAVDPLGYL